MVWHVVFHPLVVADDFKKITKRDQQSIVKAIRKKLMRDPESFGKPLLGPLKGLYRLRVGDYRVVYAIKKDQVVVLVLKVGIRRDSEVYEDMVRRLPKILQDS